MVELIMTEEEKAVELWTDLSDDALGKAVRFLMMKTRTAKLPEGMDAETHQFRQVAGFSAAFLLVCLADDVHATDMQHTVKGVARMGKDIGGWTVTVRKLTRKGGSR